MHREIEARIRLDQSLCEVLVGSALHPGVGTSSAGTSSGIFSVHDFMDLGGLVFIEEFSFCFC